MSGERVTPEAMLEVALADLDAAEAWERMVVAATERHQPLGAVLADLGAYGDLGRLADDDPALAADMSRSLLGAAPGWSDLAGRFTAWVRGQAPDRGPADLSRALRRLPEDIAVTAKASRIPVGLDDDEAAALVEELVALADPRHRREVEASPFRRWALLRVIGTPAVPRNGYPRVVVDGLVGKAGGMMLLPGSGDAVAECWIPLANARWRAAGRDRTAAAGPRELTRAARTQAVEPVEPAAAGVRVLKFALAVGAEVTGVETATPPRLALGRLAGRAARRLVRGRGRAGSDVPADRGTNRPAEARGVDVRRDGTAPDLSRWLAARRPCLRMPNRPDGRGRPRRSSPSATGRLGGRSPAPGRLGVPRRGDPPPARRLRHAGRLDSRTVLDEYSPPRCPRSEPLRCGRVPRPR